MRSQYLIEFGNNEIAPIVFSHAATKWEFGLAHRLIRRDPIKLKVV